MRLYQDTRAQLISALTVTKNFVSLQEQTETRVMSDVLFEAIEDEKEYLINTVTAIGSRIEKTINGLPKNVS